MRRHVCVAEARNRKWRELAGLLSVIFTPAAIATPGGQSTHLVWWWDPTPPTTLPARQKLVVFTEHRDRLSILTHGGEYAARGARTRWSVIHGGMGRQSAFKRPVIVRHDPEVQVLIATDAQGEEGINLQRPT